MAEFGGVTLSLLKGFAQNCQIFLYTLIAALPLGLALFFLYLGAVLLWQLRRERAQDDE